MSQPGCHSSGRRLFRTALCSLLLPLALLSIACRSHESPAAAWLPAGAPAAPPAPSDIPPAVDRIIADTVQAKTVPAALRDQKERVQAWQEMGRFYAGRHFHPAWLTVNGPRPQAAELLAAIGPLADEGLDPEGYDQPELQALVDGLRGVRSFDDPRVQQRLAHADMHLTFTYLTLAAHLASGRLQPETLHVDWYAKPRRVELASRLETALADRGSVQQTLRSYAPTSPDYVHLREALARYKAIAAHGGWPALPAAPAKLAPGAHGEAVRQLRARLAAEGDLAAPAAPAPAPAPAAGAATPETPEISDRYDDALAAAVSRFQRRHGLEPTGAVDAATRTELDVPVDERIRQIEVNLERWRWMPSDLGERYIEVNIPDFRLQVVEHGQPQLDMKVVVGKAHSRTPVFSDKMTFLVLNPSWSIPDDIVAKEIRPHVAKSRGYLARKGFEVVRSRGEDAERVSAAAVDVAQLGRPGSPYHLRQPPGPDNPLGRIKFMFPNQFDVYLHDTPAGQLFAKSERDFSHGCIRLEKPLDLANYLLKDDPKWTPEALQAAIDSGEKKTVSIPHPLPVHILYLTAWVDDDGTVEFRRDVYGHDAKLAEALAQEPPVTFDADVQRRAVKAGLGGGNGKV